MSKSTRTVLGKVGILLRGEYDSNVSYKRLDGVTYNGSFFICRKDCQGIPVENTDYWQLSAKAGEKPKNHIDYNTEEEKAEFKKEIIDEATSEVGAYIDERKSELDIKTEELKNELSETESELEIIKKIVGLIALAITAPISVMAMGYSLLFTSVASQIINSWPNKKLMNYGYLEQLKDILPGILVAVFMGFCIYPIQWLGLPDIVTLLIQVPLGTVIYIGASALLKLESFTYLWGMVKPILH